ncbi:MAG: SidA/IucD/PvdA family monooxygenase [Micromonosporaceae bacterium]|nr:SidA/IucD/PvdA family monooxygenase [Micromonosporaceae bacterium]
MAEQTTVVIGAGPAGLAVAATLHARRIDPIVLEQGDAVGTSWRRRYDGLRLNTVRWLSNLPGLRMPRQAGRWVGRDEYVAYLERYAAHHRLRTRLGVRVERIDPGPDETRRWLVSTDQEPIHASSVVVATGAFATPVIPGWPGRSRFAGELHHADSYRNPARYAGRSVLVVGGGASGLEIALLLAGGGAGPVLLSVRSCQNLFVRQWRGIPLTPPPAAQRLPTAVLDAGGAMTRRLLGTGWPSPLPGAPAGLGTALRRDEREPTVADGVVEALRDGRIRLVAAVAELREQEVVLADGEVVRPDAVIAATGYTDGLDTLVGHLGVTGPGGRLVAPAGQPIAHAPGLAFVGFTPTVTGRLLRLHSQARTAARTITAPGKPQP